VTQTAVNALLMRSKEPIWDQFLKCEHI